MLLGLKQFQLKAQEVAELLKGEVGFDFETDGLYPFNGSRAFLMGFTDAAGNKFSVYLTGHKVDDELSLLRSMALFFSNRHIRYCAHNAKFELGFLSVQFGVTVLGEVWDTEVHARIEKNNHLSYSLQACAQRLGLSKYQPMLDWLKIRGNKNLYHKAPAEIIIPYCEQDAWLSWHLRRHQVEMFKHWDASSKTKIRNVVKLEQAVLPHLFEMEKNGLLVDVGYCKRAYEYEQEQIVSARRDFEQQAGVAFVDSRKTLKPIFDAHGIRYGETALGNASFTEDALLSSRDHPLVAAIFKYRRATKRLSAYWLNFLELEHNGIIHPSIHQNKAQTGRMSISDPSCQNWSTDEDEGTAFPIRRAFVARPGCIVVSLDYSQMELRKGADEAEDHAMIQRIIDGADLHQEVADIASVKRSLAKNGRFAKQYGAGIPKIAATLGVSEAIARTISEAIDKQAPGMAAYSRMLSKTCRPYGTDWLGRRFFFDRGFEYKAFNYRIQGGCAEILKIAIIDIGEFLKQHARPETFMLVPIHDELVFNMHEKDLHLIPELKRLMIAAHRDKKTLSMDVGIEVGPNFHDLEKYEIKEEVSI